jgi:hypothetical protein
MKRPAMASRRPLERGEFSWVSLLLLLAAVSAAYLGYVWLPVYMDHLEVKRTTRDFMNQAVHERNDGILLIKLCDKLRIIEARGAPDEGGVPAQVPVADLTPDDITWERDTEVKPPMLHVAFEYTRAVYYPLLDKTQEVTLGFEHTQDIGVPNWGNQR